MKTITGQACFVLCLLMVATCCESQEKSSGEFSRSYFIKKLSSTNPLIRAQAGERIRKEFRGSEEAAETLLHVLNQSADEPSKLEVAIDSISLLRYFYQKSVIDRLEQLLRSEDPRVVIVATDTLKQHNLHRSLPKILELGERREFEAIYGFRSAILEAVMSFRSTKSVDFILKHLPELEGQSEKYALQYLSEISGQPFSESKQYWIQWWAKVDKNQFVFNEEQLPPEFGPPQDSSRPQFFGVQIDAQRFVFVIDKSGSMATPLNFVDTVKKQGYQGAEEERTRIVETRLTKAKSELESAIANLPVKSYFNIVAFDGRLASWQRNLVPASAGNKLGASRFIQALEPGGETAWFDALDATIGMDGNLEAIFFLSDGMPTVGKIVSAPKILRAMKKNNAFRRVSIHTVGLGVNRTADHFLRELAKMSDGKYRSLGEGEAELAKKLRIKPDSETFAPRRVIKRSMPPVTRLKIVNGKVADRRVKPDELVLGVVINGEARAYPLNGLTGPNREIFNDTLGGRSIAATW